MLGYGDYSKGTAVLRILPPPPLPHPTHAHSYRRRWQARMLFQRNLDIRCAVVQHYCTSASASAYFMSVYFNSLTPSPHPHLTHFMECSAVIVDLPTPKLKS